MRLQEISIAIEEKELEEGWKETLTGLAAAGLISGMPMNKNIDQDQIQHTRAQEIQQLAQQKAAPKQTPELKAKQKAEPETKSTETVTGNSNEAVLRKAAEAAGIEGIELAAFLAQCAHESLSFSRLEERGGAKRFARYEPGHKSGLAKILGNTESGDGERFKGRGFIQLTGRWNYTKAARQTGLDLVNNPELAADPDAAAILAVWFWKFRVQPRVNDYDDIKSVTRPINSKYSGLKDRTQKFEIFKKNVA